MADDKKEHRRYRVVVTAFPNIAPAGMAITKQGIGTSYSVATGRAFDEIYADRRMKGKRLIFPIKTVIAGESYMEGEDE